MHFTDHLRNRIGLEREINTAGGVCRDLSAFALGYGVVKINRLLSFSNY